MGEDVQFSILGEKFRRFILGPSMLVLSLVYSAV